jgi:hypothetical protein
LALQLIPSGNVETRLALAIGRVQPSGGGEHGADLTRIQINAREEHTMPTLPPEFVNAFCKGTMNLEDGRKWYEEIDPGFWKFTRELEDFAKKMSSLIARGDRGPQALAFGHVLLVAIELWKAGCIEDLTGYAVHNDPNDVWNAFRDAIEYMNARRDRDALCSIMRLNGFGSYQDEQGQQRAKRATAVLRMFNPDEWGVVDWRAAAMLLLLNGNKWDVDQAMKLAEKENPNVLKKTFDVIDEKDACVYNQMYRDRVPQTSLTRVADVEMAVFGLTFMVKAWNPTNPKAQYSVGQTYGKTLRRELERLDKQMP